MFSPRKHSVQTTNTNPATLATMTLYRSGRRAFEIANGHNSTVPKPPAREIGSLTSSVSDAIGSPRTSNRIIHQLRKRILIRCEKISTFAYHQSRSGSFATFTAIRTFHMATPWMRVTTYFWGCGLTALVNCRSILDHSPSQIARLSLSRKIPPGSRALTRSTSSENVRVYSAASLPLRNPAQNLQILF